MQHEVTSVEPLEQRVMISSGALRLSQTRKNSMVWYTCQQSKIPPILGNSVCHPWAHLSDHTYDLSIRTVTTSNIDTEPRQPVVKLRTQESYLEITMGQEKTFISTIQHRLPIRHNYSVSTIFFKCNNLKSHHICIAISKTKLYRMRSSNPNLKSRQPVGSKTRR